MGLPLNAVDHRDQLVKRGLIGCPLVLSPCHVVKFCNAVRRKRIRLRSIINAVSAIGGAYGGRGRKLGDGNVVGMPIRSLRTECDDYVGLNAPDVPDDRSNGSAGRDCIDRSVRISQEGHFTDTEHSGRSSQLRLANASDFHWIAALSSRTEAAAFSARGCDEVSLDSLSRVLCKRTAETERLIVGMSQNAQQF
jgi:hypothetical protein